MSDPNFLILYVKSPADSAAFYARLLGRSAADSSAAASSPNFAMFALTSGVMLGLWAVHDVAPAATSGGGAELALALDSRQAVSDCHARWQALGLTIIQPPTDMDFGHTFTALDPDGHRLRVFAPHAS